MGVFGKGLSLVVQGSYSWHSGGSDGTARHHQLADLDKNNGAMITPDR